MSKPRAEDAFIQRAAQLRETAGSYRGGAQRRLSGLASIEGDLNRMRGSIGLDVAALSRFNPQAGTGGAMDSAMARAKTLSVAASQGEKQLKQANLMQRVQMAGRAQRGEFVADQTLANQVSRQQTWQDAQRGAKSIRSNARSSMLGTVAGGLISGMTYPRVGNPELSPEVLKQRADPRNAGRV